DGDIKGKEEGKDSFFISRSLQSVPGASYQVVYGDELARTAADALERPDLNKYPTIFLLNVPTLKPKQIANLENFVNEGGGVLFSLGTLVKPTNYNRFIYKDGKGVCPAPLKNDTNPPRIEPPFEPKAGDTFQLITRDEKFNKDAGNTNTPI